MIRRLPFLMLLALATPSLAAAQVTPAKGSTPPDDTQSIKIGAVLFADWTRTIEPKSTDAAGNLYSPNAFNVSRAYINVTGQRVPPDGVPRHDRTSRAKRARAPPSAAAWSFV